MPGPNLEHPDLTQLQRNGVRNTKQAATCCRCCMKVEPGETRWGALLEYEGVMLCPSCFEDAVEADLHRDPVAFAQSMLMHVERY